MLLDLDDTLLFFDLHRSLMSFVNGRLGILPNPSGSPDAYSSIPPQERCGVHEAFYADRSALIDAYVAENPGNFETEELDEIRSWKAAVTGDFFLFRQLKDHMIFIGGKKVPTAYGVLGLSQPFSELVGTRLPVLANTTLLPFRGRIVYDGLMSSQNISFGSGIKASLNENYRAVKAGRGVVTSLPAGGSRIKKKRISPKARVKVLVGQLRKKLEEIRLKKREIKDFESDVLPVFEGWVEKNLKKERDRLTKLSRDVEDLEDALDEMILAWEDGEFRTRKEAAEEVLADFKRTREEEERARSEIHEEDREEDGNRDGDGAGGNADGKGIPDGMLDFMFATFMEEVRGIDVEDMDDAEYESARSRFEDSMKHAADGDKLAFEKALFETGADQSEENVAAVKKVFRRLAKRLHPDQNPEFGEEAKELWEELGAAKKALDLGTMERLELHWQILQGDEISTKEEARLKEFQQFLNRHVIELRVAVGDLKSHPLWGHDGEAIPKETERRIRRETAEDIGELIRMKRGLEDEIDRFRGVSRHKNRLKRRKVAPKKAGAKAKKKAVVKTKKKAAVKTEKKAEFQPKKKTAAKPKKVAKKKAGTRTKGASEKGGDGQQEFGF